MKKEGLKMLNRALLVGRLTRDPELNCFLLLQKGG